MQKIAGKAPNVTVNPDEVVALGAAVQAGVLAGVFSALYHPISRHSYWTNALYLLGSVLVDVAHNVPHSNIDCLAVLTSSLQMEKFPRCTVLRAHLVGG